MDYPDRTRESGAADLAEAVDRSAGHISWYQLTIERNTHFWSAPPALPDESALESIQKAGEAILTDAGLHQYEVSAFSKEGEESRHNLNYWRFGDYIELGRAPTARSLSPTAPLFELNAPGHLQTILP